ncbi:MAG: ATP-binding protein [Chloroflexota bacterium]|nr:ATP-binding protein [Chloroflexota bacterium]
MQRKRLGVVVDGTFNEGLTVRLDSGVSTEDLRIGDFAIVEGEENRYFSMIADMQLRTTDQSIAADPPRDISPFVAQALAGTSIYGVVQVDLRLMMKKPDPLTVPRGTEEEQVQPVRTIPMHFAELCQADAMDFATVFGKEGGLNFWVGTPLTMDTHICLQLDRLVERSSGIFGQTGTGKSFLARIVLSGIIRSDAAVNLIFDMHNEYAFDKQSEDGVWVRGLRQIFGSQVMVYSLDEKAAARQNVDVTLQIGLNQIEAEDVLLLAEELNLRGTAEATIGLLRDLHGSRWLAQLIEMSPDDLSSFCEISGAHPASVAALQRQLRIIGRRSYIVPQADFSVIDDMVAALDRGRHIILQFGRHNRILDYALVANLVTRRVRQLYREKVERYEQSQEPSDRPRPLMITIEEAHKFLNPAVARQTIFGQIAREMRKYHVTLMVIDQRPSGIDGEVISQLGTRITGRLTEARDIDAVLTGVSGRRALRSALESLDTREQVLLMGHAVPMPIVIQTRKYDEDFYRAVGAEKRSVAQDTIDLFGE